MLASNTNKVVVFLVSAVVIVENDLAKDNLRVGLCVPTINIVTERLRGTLQFGNSTVGLTFDEGSKRLDCLFLIP